jgi:hypothetical protein
MIGSRPKKQIADGNAAVSLEELVGLLNPVTEPVK